MHSCCPKHGYLLILPANCRELPTVLLKATKASATRIETSKWASFYDNFILIVGYFIRSRLQEKKLVYGTFKEDKKLKKREEIEPCSLWEHLKGSKNWISISRGRCCHQKNRIVNKHYSYESPNNHLSTNIKNKSAYGQPVTQTSIHMS